MQIEQWPIAKVKPYPGNPRDISDRAVEKVAASIKEFGFNQPIAVDKAGVVIAGHTRLLAAKHLKLKTAPVVVLDLPDAKAKAYRLADNRTHEEAKWLDEMLRVEFDSLKLSGLDDLRLWTGFDSLEIARVFAATEKGNTDPDAYVPEPVGIPVARLGDVWTLGKHRIVCGDATEAGTVAAALKGHQVNVLITDPPYGVDYDPMWRNRVKRQDGSLVGAKAVGEVKNDDRADWREAWALFPGNVLYVWNGGLLSATVADSIVASGFNLRAQVIWKKQQFVIGRGDYHWQHECCWYAVRVGKPGGWTGDRKQSTVWDIDAPSGWRQKHTGPDAHQGIHSTQKPVECMKRPIENNTKLGEAVYDPFLGSGTTIMAAELAGRIGLGIELNPLYVDVAVRRWQEFTGKAATLEDGRSFAEVEKERGKAKQTKNRRARSGAGKAEAQGRQARPA